MLIRISLIVAIIAALAVGALNFTQVKTKIITLQANLATETAAHVKFEGDFHKTSAELKKTSDTLKQTKATLEATTEERDKAVAEQDKQVKRAEKLADDLKKTTDELTTSRDELAAYKATSYTPKQILGLGDDLRNLQKEVAGFQAENKALGMSISKLKTELARYEDPDKPVFMPAALTGKVMDVDPKFNFVVLNIGENQSVKEYGQLLVHRNGQLVAKVIVRTLRKDECIANVMPGTQIGEVMEGDQVIPAYPE